MQRLSRFAHCWDLLFNRGRFRTAAPLLWSAPGTSPFAEVMAVADFLHRRNGRVHGLSPRQLASALVARRPNDPAMRAALEADARAAAHPADFLPDSTSEENR